MDGTQTVMKRYFSLFFAQHRKTAVHKICAGLFDTGSVDIDYLIHVIC